MVQSYLPKILAVTADDINEQDLDQLYEDITTSESNEMNFELEKDQVKNMYKIFQKILLYKGEQVKNKNTTAH